MTQPRNTDISARSVVLSLLLGMRRPRRPGAQLAAWCALFGVSDGTARVALSRMVAAGELTNEAGVYELAGRVRHRRAEQEFAVMPRFVDDDGNWTMQVVIADGRSPADRATLRNALRHARFAVRRTGVWLRPANLAQILDDVVAEQCERYAVRPAAPRALATALFAPAEWALVARSLRAELNRSSAGLPNPRAIVPAFVAGTKVAAHLRADPLLPSALLPARWPGSALRTAYAEYRDVFSDAVRDWFAGLA